MITKTHFYFHNVSGDVTIQWGHRTASSGNCKRVITLIALAILEALGKLFAAICSLFKKPAAASITSCNISLTSASSNTASIVLPIIQQKPVPSLQEIELAEILTDEPTWKPVVDSWVNVSVEDKVWLLKLYLLRNYHVCISSLDWIHGTDFFTMRLSPSSETLELLKPDKKAKIEQQLMNKEKLILWNKKLKKLSNAIFLLKNLEILDLDDNNLVSPLDFSKLPKLKKLTLLNNQLKLPPNIKDNADLTYLRLSCNPLIEPPDVSQNANLIELAINSTKIETAPNVSHNLKLEQLYLNQNRIRIAPDLRQNTQLQRLNLCGNLLDSLPDFSHNKHLTFLALSNNQLSNQDKMQLASLKQAQPSSQIYF